MDESLMLLLVDGMHLVITKCRPREGRLRSLLMSVIDIGDKATASLQI